MGFKIRQFLREVFGSRVSAVLEETVMRVRADCEDRLRDKDEVIADLRTRLAQIEMKAELYEKVLIPLKSPVGNLLQPKDRPVFESSVESGSSWSAIKNSWMAQEFSEEKPADEGIPVKVS